MVVVSQSGAAPPPSEPQTGVSSLLSLLARLQSSDPSVLAALGPDFTPDSLAGAQAFVEQLQSSGSSSGSGAGPLSGPAGDAVLEQSLAMQLQAQALLAAQQQQQQPVARSGGAPRQLEAAALEAAVQLREEVDTDSIHRLIGAARQLQQATVSLPSGPCTGPDCCCHSSLADATKWVFNDAASIKPAAADAPTGDSVTDQRQLQRQQLYLSVRTQQVSQLAPVLLSASRQLIDGGHSDAVLLEVANTFYRHVAVPISKLLNSDAALLCSPSDAEDSQRDRYHAAAKAAGKLVLKKVQESGIIEQVCADKFLRDAHDGLSEALDFATVWRSEAILWKLQKALKAVPAGTQQLTDSQAAKLSGWLDKQLSCLDLGGLLLRTRRLFVWASAVGRLAPDSPLAHAAAGELLLKAAGTAASFLPTAAACSQLQALGVMAGLPDRGDVEQAVAEALAVMSLVAANLGGYAEVTHHMALALSSRGASSSSSSGGRAAAAAHEQQQFRLKMGTTEMLPPEAPPEPLATVRSSRQEEKAPSAVVKTMLADITLLGWLSNILLAMYSVQLQRHCLHVLLQQQQPQQGESTQQEGDTPPAAAGDTDATSSAAAAAAAAATAAAAGVAAANPDSWQEAEGLLLLSAAQLRKRQT